MKYSKRIVNKICRLLSKGPLTISQVCSRAGISERTYYYWQKKPECAERITEAKQHFDEAMVAEAKKSLLKLVRGFQITEVMTKTIPGPQGLIITETTLTEKHVPPSAQAIILVLCKLDPENYKIKFHKSVTGKQGKSLIPEQVLDKVELEVIPKVV